MDITQIKEVLDRFNELPVFEHEKTVFDIGIRGHFENPTTEVLAFFCNGLESHGMGNLVANSLLTLLEQKTNKTIHHSEIPVQTQREIETKNRKRIDLLLKTEFCLVVIETKVGHNQINPFDEYEHFGDHISEIEGLEPIYVILSPEGNIDNPLDHPRWIGISFNELSQVVRNNLTQYFFDKPFNKWLLILKDFLLHMESFMPNTEQDELHLQFLLNNLSVIAKAWQQLIDSLGSIRETLETRPELDVHKHSWFGIPSFKCSPKNSSDEVILFATPDDVDERNPANIGKHLFLQAHISLKESDSNYKTCLTQFESRIIDTWSDNKLGYFRWPIQYLNSQSIVNEINDVISVIQKFKQNDSE